MADPPASFLSNDRLKEQHKPSPSPPTTTTTSKVPKAKTSHADAFDGFGHKQQINESILKVDGIRPRPSASTSRATDDARKHQEEERNRKLHPNRGTGRSDNASGGAVIAKRPDKRKLPPTYPDTKKAPPLPAIQPPVTTHQPRSEIWEFDTAAGNKNTCCTIL